MSDSPSLPDETALIALAQEASAPSDFALLSAEAWPGVLAKRRTWLQRWDQLLAPLFQPTERESTAFALKPHTINALMEAWGTGLPAEATSQAANSAALLLMAYRAADGLVEAVNIWGEAARTQTDQAVLARWIDEGQVIKNWLARWKRQDAERALLANLQALNGLLPQDEERLQTLSGDLFKVALMQVDPDKPRVELRDRVDNMGLTRYFKNDSKASNTLFVLRTKSVSTANERLEIGRWDAALFFEKLQKTLTDSPMNLQLSMTVKSVLLAGHSVDEACDACVFSDQFGEISLLLTVTAQHTHAVIQLGSMVSPHGKRVDEYCERLLGISDAQQSPRETMLRATIIDQLLPPALDALKQSSRPESPGHGQNSFAG